MNFESTFKRTFSTFLQLDKYSGACDIIKSAVERYKRRFFAFGTGSESADFSTGNDVMSHLNLRGKLTNVEVVMNNNKGCEKYPHFEMDEHCELHRQKPLRKNFKLNHSLVPPTFSSVVKISFSFCLCMVPRDYMRKQKFRNSLSKQFYMQIITLTTPLSRLYSFF